MSDNIINAYFYVWVYVGSGDPNPDLYSLNHLPVVALDFLSSNLNSQCARYWESYSDYLNITYSPQFFKNIFWLKGWDICLSL